MLNATPPALLGETPGGIYPPPLRRPYLIVRHMNGVPVTNIARAANLGSFWVRFMDETRMCRALAIQKQAERLGFEPRDPVKGQLLSRQLPSASRPPLRLRGAIYAPPLGFQAFF